MRCEPVGPERRVFRSKQLQAGHLNRIDVDSTGGAIPSLHFGHRCHPVRSASIDSSEAKGRSNASRAAIKSWNFSVALGSPLFLSG